MIDVSPLTFVPTPQLDTIYFCQPQVCEQIQSDASDVSDSADSVYDYMPNTISNQKKDQEITYIPREWVTPKLGQIKTSSSLLVHTKIIPNTLKITENVISTTIVTYLDKTATMEFHFFDDGIVKLNCVNPSNPSKFSFELIEKPAKLTPYLIQASNLYVTEAFFEISMNEFQIKFTVEFNPFILKVFSTKNSSAPELLLEINSHKSLVFDENLTADFTFHNEYLYGLPEHASDFLLQDTQNDLPYRFYNQDVPAFPIGSKNSLYATVPIIISRSKNSSTLLSMYWQNASETYIDIHKKNDKSNTAYWLSERGNLECYIFVSHSNAAHYKSFSNVLGHCAMPQFFSLGYHQCRWSYLNEKDLLSVNTDFNFHEIPCDTLTLDIDHTNACRYFTWNLKHFPDPLAMQTELLRDGRQLITIADPHIKVDKKYSVYSEAEQKDLFIKDKEYKPFVGKCWPGDSVYYDFLNEEAQELWASQYSFEKYKLSSSNVWAWNDMNEPSVFEYKGNHMPLDNIQTFKSLSDPHNTFQIEHRDVHNIYGYLQHRATYNGMLKRNTSQNIRPHVLTRSFYAGSQKWTTVWTGDTEATWDHLKNTVPQLLSLSLCGLSNCGGDVGGFIGDPEPELAVRWYQLGSFMPYFRGHSEITSKRREPWLFEKKYFEIIKETIKEKYRLLPYWYTCFEEHCRTDEPILRPVWYDQTQVFDSEIMKEQERFMIGEGLLIVPILEENKMTISGALKGLSGRWYDFYSKREIQQNEEINTGLERIGCFVKGGKIVPTFDIRSYVKSSKDAKESNIVINVALNNEGKAQGKMYFDDGETFDYKKRIYKRKDIKFENNILTWEDDKQGIEYNLVNRVSKVIIMGIDEKLKNAYLLKGDTKQKIMMNQDGNSVSLEFIVLANCDWKIILE